MSHCIVSIGARLVSRKKRNFFWLSLCYCSFSHLEGPRGAFAERGLKHLLSSSMAKLITEKNKKWDRYLVLSTGMGAVSHIHVCWSALVNRRGDGGMLSCFNALSVSPCQNTLSLCNKVGNLTLNRNCCTSSHVATYRNLTERQYLSENPLLCEDNSSAGKPCNVVFWSIAAGDLLLGAGRGGGNGSPRRGGGGEEELGSKSCDKASLRRWL